MPIRSLALALGLIVASTALFAAPAEGEDCPELKLRKKTVDEWYKKTWRKCSPECLDGTVTRLLLGHSIAGGHVDLIVRLATTDTGRYYFEVESRVSMGRVRGDKGYTVRATQDPLVLTFEDNSEMRLYPACDKSSGTCTNDKRQQCLCGFYNVSREQLEELSRKKLSEIKMFLITPKTEEVYNLRQHHTKDGRSYVDFTWKEKKDKSAELMRLTRCLLGSE
jgi:hypothetical protein